MTEPRVAAAHSTVGEPEVVVGGSADEVSALAAQRIVDALGAAITARGRADFATTGGSTPVGIYKVLSERLRGAIDWGQVQFWWGDDRFVPRDHPLSNVLALDSILLAETQFAGQSGNQFWATDVAEGREPGLVVPVEHVHPFPCAEAIGRNEGPDWCAAQYADELQRSGIAVERGFPVFDLVLLGLGPDGHLMSIFPGSDAFDRTGWALDIPAPTHVEPHVARVTLHPAVLGVARSVLMVTGGGAKADVVERIFTTLSI